jgi:hypothetical protein
MALGWLCWLSQKFGFRVARQAFSHCSCSSSLAIAKPVLSSSIRATWSTNRHVARQPPARGGDPRRRDRVQHHPDLDAPAPVLELEDPQDGLVERALLVCTT